MKKDNSNCKTLALSFRNEKNNIDIYDEHLY